MSPVTSRLGQVSSRSHVQPEVAAREADLRCALLRRLIAQQGLVRQEFSLPSERLRADVAFIGSAHLEGFEIKSSVDRLDRLPRQVTAYEDVFDLCHAVVAPRHVGGAIAMLPPEWGVLTTGGRSGLIDVRPVRPHGRSRAEVLVRLLWRSESAQVLSEAEVDYPETAPRAHLWDLILTRLTAQALRVAVAGALQVRDPAAARVQTRWASSS